VNDLKYAIPGALMWVTLAYLMFTTGTHIVQSLTLGALFIGALGQFIAQDNMPVAQTASIFISWIAVLMTGVALVMWSL
jgi:hypothetical protein